MSMTPEAWTLIGIGVAILVAIATSHRQTRADVKSFRDELRRDMKAERDALRAEMKSDRDALRAEMKADHDALRADIKADHDALRTELKADTSALDRKIDDIRDEISGLRERMARLEGLLEGLREAITGRQFA